MTTKAKKQKTPSLAELRKLAKKKGMEVTTFEGDLLMFWNERFSSNFRIETEGTSSHTEMRLGRIAFFAALSVLPDKETSR